jgi:hypothetical protein
MPSNVDITQFGQLGAFLAVVVVFLKYLAAENKRRDDAAAIIRAEQALVEVRRDEAHQKLTQAIDMLSLNSSKQIASIDRNTTATDKLVESSEVAANASQETLQFMKNLNGSLRKAVEDHKK